MIRPLFLLGLLAATLLAEPIALTPDRLNYDLSGLGEMTIDASGTLSAREVRLASDLTPLTRSNRGYDQRRHWVRYRFINTSDEALSAVLFNPRPGMQRIDLHLFGPDGHTKRSMGALVSPDERSFESIFSNARLDLAPGEQVDVVVAMETFGVMEAAWQLASVEGFYAIESSRLMVMVFFGTFFLTLIFKNLLLYNSVRESLYLFYSLFLLSNVLFNATVGGLVYLLFSDSLPGYLLVSMGWFTAALISSFIWIFTYLFFSYGSGNRFLWYLTAVIIAVNSAIFLLVLYGFVVDVSVLHLTPLALGVGYLESLLLLLVAVVMFFKKRPGSGYFLLAHLSYAVSIVLFLMLLDGGLDQGVFVAHLPLFGTMFSVFLMSISLTSRLKTLKSENNRYRDQIQRNEHFVTVGSSVYFIVHQWKQPLSALSALVMKLRHRIEKQPQAPLVSIADLAEKIEDKIAQMDESMNNARGFFTRRLMQEQPFSVQGVFEKIRHSLQDRLQTHGIVLRLSGDDETLTGNANLFLNAFLNLVNNAIDAIVASKRRDGLVLIAVHHTSAGLEVRVQDNGGGMDPAILKRIFEPFNTTKEEGTGIGLLLAKNILKDYFGATLDLKSDTSGTLLIVTLAPNDTSF